MRVVPSPFNNDFRGKAMKNHLRGIYASLILLSVTLVSVSSQAQSLPGCTGSFSREIQVDSVSKLKSALSAAAPGDQIVIQQGTYAGNFVMTKSGTSSTPIGICGSGNVILDAGSTSSGYGLHIKASRLVVANIKVTNAKKGIILDSANYNLLSNLEVYKIGEEGIHFRTHSSNNTLQDSKIYNIGITTPAYGEGVYIGSAKSNWSTYTGGSPDKSDNNKILRNNIYDCRAENIDIKEGTTGTLIDGNEFDGSLLQNVNAADSWIDVKGNNITIRNNHGKNLGSKMLDGYQTHQPLEGWSKNIVFSNNTSDVRGSGYAIRVDSKSSNVTVECSNTVTNAGSGLSNVTCTGSSRDPASDPTPTPTPSATPTPSPTPNSGESPGSAPGQNLALASNVLSSTKMRSDHPLSKLFDNCTTSSCSSGTDASELMEIQFDLKASYALDSVQLFGDADGNWVSANMDIYYKNASSESFVLHSSKVNTLTNSWVKVNMAGIKARYVMIRVRGASGKGSVQARELKILTAAQ
jgi:hypothetical protein